MSTALAGIAVPTLVICGERDERAPLQVAQHLHKAIAASTLVTLPDVGHVCSIEAPEAFNCNVGAFLREHRTRTT